MESFLEKKKRRKFFRIYQLLYLQINTTFDSIESYFSREIPGDEKFRLGAQKKDCENVGVKPNPTQDKTPRSRAIRVNL